MKAKKSLSRNELYELVWQEPMSLLSKRFAISDVGLAKVCRKHNIPYPTRGYWAKKQHGHETSRTPLPPMKQAESIELRDNSNGQYGTVHQDSAISELIDSERVPENKIEVAETLRGAHALVSQANQELQGALTNRFGIVEMPENACLSVKVSKSSLRRALLIIDAILKAMIQRGYEVVPGPKVGILGQTIGFSIDEKLETKREPIEDHDLDQPYTFGYNRFNEKRCPSGLLSLHITDGGRYWLNGCRYQWNDTAKHPLEKRLNQFVAGMIEMASRVKLHNEEEKKKEAAREIEEARRRDEERLRAEKRKEYKAEKARVDKLLNQVKDWQKSKHLREMIEAVRLLHSVDEPVLPSSEIGQWIDWAILQADRLDPLCISPPSILDDESLKEEPPNRPTYRW